MISDNFTNRLNQAMKEQKLRQVDLKNKTKKVMEKYIKDYNGEGIDKGLLNKYIKGIAIPKQDNMFILAKALNVSVSWLMGYDIPFERQNIEKYIKKHEEISDKMLKKSKFHYKDEESGLSVEFIPPNGVDWDKLSKEEQEEYINQAMDFLYETKRKLKKNE